MDRGDECSDDSDGTLTWWQMCGRCLRLLTTATDLCMASMDVRTTAMDVQLTATNVRCTTTNVWMTAIDVRRLWVLRRLCVLMEKINESFYGGFQGATETR